jgi:hypothetical protein
MSPIQKPDLIKGCGCGGFSMKTLMVLALVGIALGADTPPPMKDGLWISHGTTVESPPNRKREQTISLCIKRANREQTPVPMPGDPPRGADCKLVKRSMDRKGGRVETECVISGQRSRMTNTVVILSDNEQTQTTEIAYNPPMRGTAKITTVQNLKYIGVCPAGMANGDVISSDGKITHPPGR